MHGIWGRMMRYDPFLPSFPPSLPLLVTCFIFDSYCSQHSQPFDLSDPISSPFLPPSLPPSLLTGRRRVRRGKHLPPPSQADPLSVPAAADDRPCRALYPRGRDGTSPSLPPSLSPPSQADPLSVPAAEDDRPCRALYPRGRDGTSIALPPSILALSQFQQQQTTALAELSI